MNKITYNTININNRIKYKDKINSYKNGSDKIDLSVVIPIYNEEENVITLYEELQSVLEKLPGMYEVILVDDGSCDKTFKNLLEIHRKNKNFKIIKLRRNFGQTQAMKAGFEYAAGQIIITLDADLQNDPEDIPKILGKMEEGYDIVSGWRKNRKDKTVTRKIPSVIANKIISGLFGVRLHDFGCTLKAYRKEVIENIELYGEMHRYIPALASWMGIKVAEIPVNHRLRKSGKAKYGISRTIRVILDIITIKFLLTYSKKPMQIFGLIGVTAALVGTVITVWLIVERLFFDQPLSTRPLFILSISMIFIGAQLITMGLLGEIMMRTYHEGAGKPTYVIKEIIDK
ncbi:MAG: glycosyltransferase family 2 protein [Actinobacteria bacterium]|nr:glycosyltransferase family 2 protein [Actinomycetota bacterium]